MPSAMSMNDDEKIVILISNGWKRDFIHWYKCLYCHKEITPWGYNIYSPKFAPYHVYCALQTKSAARIFAKCDQGV